MERRNTQNLLAQIHDDTQAYMSVHVAEGTPGCTYREKRLHEGQLADAACRVHRLVKHVLNLLARGVLRHDAIWVQKATERKRQEDDMRVTVVYETRHTFIVVVCVL